MMDAQGSIVIQMRLLTASALWIDVSRDFVRLVMGARDGNGTYKSSNSPDLYNGQQIL